MTVYTKSHPFIGSLKERNLLNKSGSRKETYHVVLDLKGSGMTYRVGDSLAVFPLNRPELVERTLLALRATGDETVFEKQSTHPLTLRQYFTEKANITQLHRKVVAEIAQRQPNIEKKEHLDVLLGEHKKEALKAYLEVRELWDALTENQEVVFAAEEIPFLLTPLLPRFYSIASSQSVVGEEVHLTVALLSYEANGFGRRGVCTHFLSCQVALNEPRLSLYVQPNHGFTLPEDPNASVIMVGPGTGVAPFRAFMQERKAKNATGENWLFFGEWTHASDYLYEDYWNALQAEGFLKVSTAFSRDQETKIYVQHRMHEEGEELYRRLRNGAFLYVCGDAHRMARDVDAMLHKIVQEQGKMDDVSAKAFIKQLKTEKRYLRDVY